MELAVIQVAGFVLALVLIVLWIALPFAIFGTKPLLQQLLREAQATNKLLAQTQQMKALIDEAGELRSLLRETKMAIEYQTRVLERPKPGSQPPGADTSNPAP